MLLARVPDLGWPPAGLVGFGSSPLALPSRSLTASSAWSPATWVSGAHPMRLSTPGSVVNLLHLAGVRFWGWLAASEHQLISKIAAVAAEVPCRMGRALAVGSAFAFDFSGVVAKAGPGVVNLSISRRVIVLLGSCTVARLLAKCFCWSAEFSAPRTGSADLKVSNVLKSVKIEAVVAWRIPDATFFRRGSRTERHCDRCAFCLLDR